MTEKKTAYGLHLMIDCYKANAYKLADVGLLYKTLNELPAMINMNKVGFPHIIQFTEDNTAGLSGFIFIIESHISIHTYSKKRFLSLDVYSCTHFNHTKILDYIKAIYEVKELEKYLIERGKQFPR